MTSTSTELQRVVRASSLFLSLSLCKQAVNVHFFLGGTHGALQDFLETWNTLEGLAGKVEHVGVREGGAVGGRATVGAAWWRNIARDRRRMPRAMLLKVGQGRGWRGQPVDARARLGGHQKGDRGIGQWQGKGAARHGGRRRRGCSGQWAVGSGSSWAHPLAGGGRRTQSRPK